MINILTLHFGTPAWLQIQQRHIKKYTTLDYKLWLGGYKLKIPKSFSFLNNWEYINLNKCYPEEAKNEHYLQMEWMYKNILSDQMQDDDILVFMDSDAFPCSLNWDQLLREILLTNEDDKKADVVGLYQVENRGIRQPDEYYPYPDLCFFATTKKVWRENNLQWGMFKVAHQNPGFGMADRLREANLRIAALRRSNKFNSNNVMFGVYGNIIYHQACGSRALVGRPEVTPGAPTPNKSRQCYTGQDLYGRESLGNWFKTEFEEECKDIISTNTEIFDIIYNKLQEDTDASFVSRYFLGQP